MGPRGLRARFEWNGQRHDLPLEDIRLLSQLDWLPSSTGSVPVKRLLGFRPDRLVVALGHPNRGYCPKVVAGLLQAA